MRKTQGSNNSGEVVKKFQEKLENNGRIMNYNKTPKNQIEILRNNELENLWKERLKNNIAVCFKCNKWFESVEIGRLHDISHES